MICGWYNWDPEDDDPRLDPPCPNEATHNFNCNVGRGTPVCAEHTCRCSVPLQESHTRQKTIKVDPRDAELTTLRAQLADAKAVIDEARLHDCPFINPTNCMMHEAIAMYDSKYPERD